jgi:hypothetical protein
MISSLLFCVILSCDGEVSHDMFLDQTGEGVQPISEVWFFFSSFPLRTLQLSNINIVTVNEPVHCPVD